MKTTVTLFIFFTLFTVNTVAQHHTHTVFEPEDGPQTIGIAFSIAFSPDGKTLASTGGNSIYLWDIDTATQKASFNHGTFLDSVAFSPDGTTLASTGGSRIHLWDVDAATQKTTLNAPETFVNSVAFSPDGTTLATGGDRIHLWDVDAATQKTTLNAPETFVNSVAFSPDGKTLATGGDDLSIHLWDVDAATQKAVLNHGRSVNSVAFSPDGTTLASASGNSIHLWDVDAATHKAAFDHGRSVNSVAFSPDGTTLASAGGNSIHLWDVDAATHKAAFDHGRSVNSVAFSPDGTTLASAGRDPSIHLWDVDASRVKITLPVQDRSRVVSVAFSPDGTTLASVGRDPRIHLWDVDAATQKTTLGIHWVPGGDSVVSVAFSPDGTTLASAGGNSIHLWDVDAATHKAAFDHERSVVSVAFSPDGTTLASASGNSIHLWDVDAATHKAAFDHERSVVSVAFSPDGTTLASASGNSIHLWDVDAATHKAAFDHGRSVVSVAFSPDGTTLASASGNSIHLWDVDAATHKAAFDHGRSVNSVAFSPDGTTLASAGRWSEGEGHIQLWDVDTATDKAVLNHEHSVFSVAFSPDGTTLASAGDDPRIHLWQLSIAHVNVTPDPVVPPAIGEQFTINLSIVEGENVGGYQFTVRFNETILRYVESANGDYLPPGSFFVPPVISENAVTLGATSLTGTSNGDGVLATVTFEVLEVKGSEIILSDAILTDSAGKHLSVLTNIGRIEPAHPSTSAVVDLTPSSVLAPAVGEQLAFNIRISEGQNVAGYLINLEYDINVLKPILASHGVYLPDASPDKPLVSAWIVTLGASSPTGVGNGAGVLATVTFEVLAVQASIVNVSGYLTTPSGLRSTPIFKGAEVIAALLGDVNRDGTVNILDLVLVSSSFGKQVSEGGNPADVNEDGIINVVDLVKVAGALGGEAAAPSLPPQILDAFSAAEVQRWLTQAQHVDLNDPISQRGIRFLEQLLTALIPKETALLVNYPNPFNPETWIPYQLAEPAEVTLYIYAVNGTLIRTLALGHQPVGMYQSKARAAYWDGRNEVGESVASGIYFYTLTAGDFTATRKMLIQK